MGEQARLTKGDIVVGAREGRVGTMEVRGDGVWCGLGFIQKPALQKG